MKEYFEFFCIIKAFCSIMGSDENKLTKQEYHLTQKLYHWMTILLHMKFIFRIFAYFHWVYHEFEKILHFACTVCDWIFCGQTMKSWDQKSVYLESPRFSLQFSHFLAANMPAWDKPGSPWTPIIHQTGLHPQLKTLQIILPISQKLFAGLGWNFHTTFFRPFFTPAREKHALRKIFFDL